MRENDLRGTQEVTSESQEFDSQIFSTGVYLKFLLGFYPILNIHLRNCVFFEVFSKFFITLEKHHYVDYCNAILLRERKGNTGKVCVKIINPYLVCTQKAHKLEKLRKITKKLVQNG